MDSGITSGSMGTMNDKPAIRIGVFGHGERGKKQVDPSAREWIESFGACIARSGAILITGGAGGLAEFARRGALSENGSVVSICPDDRSGTNKEGTALGTIIASGQGKLGRVHLLVQSIDLGFSLGGGSGTLVEILGCYMLGVPLVAVEGLAGGRDPDPMKLLHDVTALTFGDVKARQGFFDAKDRNIIVAPIFCSRSHAPEIVLALGHARLRGEV